jgi:HTH-type transcriptional regulator/antitoxin HipB
MTDLAEIAQRIREERKRLRLTQKELALQAKVSRALLAELERGRLPELGIKKLLRILRAVGLDLRLTTLNLQRPTLEDLLEEETKPQ